MENTTLTCRLYKDEYNEAQLNYIHKTYKMYEESPSVLTIEGTPEELRKAAGAIYLSDEEFKKIFPEYLTLEERQEYTAKKLKDLKLHIAGVLCQIIENGDRESKDFKDYRDFYLKMTEK